MRFRTIAATLFVGATLSLTACSGGAVDLPGGVQVNAPSVGVDTSNPSAPAISIDSAAALKTALEAAGIQDVHPVNDGNTVAAWAAVPEFKKCPVLFKANEGGNGYTATELLKTDGTRASLEGLPANPDALAFAGWALKHLDLMNQCRGTEPPAEWPTTV